MKITFLLPGIDLSGGVKVVATYAKMLSKRGHDVNVVFPRKPLTVNPRSWVSRARAYWRQKAHPDRGHFSGYDHLLKPARVSKESHPLLPGGMFPVLRNDIPDADVIIATYWETAFWIAELPKSFGNPFYLIQHYETWDCDEKQLQRMQGSWQLPLRKIVVARWLKDLAREKFNDPGALLLHNGVDLEHFNSPLRKMNETPSVGFTYSWAPWKRSDLLAEVVERVRRTIPDLQVRTFGQYNPSSRMPYPQGGKHVFQPSQSEIPGLYASVDVWLLGSDTEGFGLPVLEAMACRTPVVTTACDGTVDIARDCEGAILTPTDDPERMAEAVLSILTDRKGWEKRSTAARKRAELFRWDKACDALEAILSGKPAEFDATASVQN